MAKLKSVDKFFKESDRDDAKIFSRVKSKKQLRKFGKKFPRTTEPSFVVQR